MGGREPDPRRAEHGAVRYRLLDSDEWQLAREARLAALDDAPDSFLPRQPPESLWTEQQWRRSWQSGLWTVAQANDLAVGLARLSQEGADAYVESVWTHPQYRRRGVASALVRQLVRTRSPSRSGEIFVWVIHPNPAALRLYQKLGFEQTDQRQFLESLDRVEERLRFNGVRRPS